MNNMTPEQITELLQTLRYISWNLKSLAENGLTIHNKESKTVEPQPEEFDLYKRLKRED